MCMCVSNFGSRPALDGRVLRSADGFVAFTADALCSWDPSSQRPPSSITMNGSLLQKGTLKAPLQPLAAQTNAVPRPDLWGKLAQAKRGWVRVDQFAKVFKVSPVHNPKKATQKLLSKLYKRGLEVENDDTLCTNGQGGRPAKAARTKDLQLVYATD